MATNVFGNPITNETLKEMPEYKDKQTITQRDRANVAMVSKNSEKRDAAKEYVDKLKSNCEAAVSTSCLFYNATGDTIKLVSSTNWWGKIGPVSYPSEIENGQWGCFLHVKIKGDLHGSSATVVYRCKSVTGQECDWMVTWDNPWDRISTDNKVYTVIQEATSFKNNWPIIKSIMTQMNNDADHHQGTSNGFKSTAVIGEDASPTLFAVLTVSPDHLNI